ncbi:bifunctional 4-hydroxy-2-oxoglutarate aldolase/2-dehydro-3-deoxy-phosphogluconate aldolase [Streptomyces aculeolatus]|uniref:bifunctional 4-hydroxy-2-oxoglutarate aldolase/2-dehydro-3-deoxy-phosphogluconate aldolase n=1 Tax=Streptomyces aculeolatus TaxID=270689 RepID=UPI000566491E|nr:2-dehydro-3-deoxy-phosphogluconate aldolase [Streptomyces aculeolatus]
MYRWEITRAALEQRVVAIVRSDTYDGAAATADSLLSAGISSLEISLTTPFALELVSSLRREVGAEAVIGAGTVLDAASARLAVDAGARYLVAPNLDAGVVATAHRYGVPVFAGVATPTEAVRALELGVDVLKLFPASAHEPGWVKDVRAALPQAAVLPTGGISIADAPDWIAAGAVGVGMGSALSGGDREEVAKRAADLLARLAAV